jgi:uncharacterized surface protein with fasciclin (FAS1) repeats
MKNAFKITVSAAVMSIAAGMAFADAHAVANPMVGGAEMFADKNIIENVVNSADHTTLVAAVTAAGLVDTLSGTGPFTVFAPTNDAFAKLDAAQLAELLLPENQAALAEILTCHVVAADVSAEALLGLIADNDGAYDVATVGGCTLTAEYNNEVVTLTDERGQVATVTVADVVQSNGVVHVIDTVVLPKE